MNLIQFLFAFSTFSNIKCTTYQYTLYFLPTGPSPSSDTKFEISCSGNFMGMEVSKDTTTRTVSVSPPGEATVEVSDLVEYMTGSNHTTNKAITIKLTRNSSSDKASCIGIANNTHGSDSFHIVRNGKHDNSYIVQTFCDVVGVCQFVIVTTVETRIDIAFPKRRNFSNPNCSISYKNVLYGQDNLVIQDQFPANSVIQIQASCDLTGTYIKSDDSIAVFSGSHSIIVGWGDTTDFMMSQLLPTTYWGTEYIIHPYPYGKSGDIISIVTEKNETEIHITGYGRYFLEEKYQFVRRRIENDRPIRIWASKAVGVAHYIHDIPTKSSAMLIVAPTSQYISDINILNYGIFKTGETYLTFNENSTGFDDKTEVKKSNYYAGKLQTPTNVNSIKFGGYVVSYHSESVLTAASVGYGFNSQETPGNSAVPGDRIDNNEDGKIDEDTQCREVSLNLGKSFVIPIIGNNGASPTINYIDERIQGSTCLRSNASSSNPITTSAILQHELSYVVTGYPSAGSSAFTSFPVESLGLEYFALTYCHTGTTCTHECSVAAAYDGTELFVRGHGSMTLNKNQVYPLTDNDDITGTYIKASNPIAVTCGITDTTTVSQFQLPPDDTWGKNYRIAFQESDSGTIRLMTSDGNTVVTLMEYEYEETGTIDTSGIVLNKTYTYRTVYAIVDPGDYKDINIENNTVYHLEANRPILVVYISSTPPYPFITVGSSYSLSQLEMEGIVNGNCRTTQIPFAYLDDEKYFIPYRTVAMDKIASWWLRVNETVSPHNVSEQVPGDQIDNDGDGLVDEDFCGFLVTDLDGKSFLFDIDIDGALNEDCKGCPMGEEINEYLQCSVCEIGTYRNAVGIDKCIECPTNHTTFFDNADSPSLCVDVCFEGYEYDPTSASCGECAVGYYKEGNSSDWRNYNFTERWNCTQCPSPKTTLRAGTQNAADCTDHCDIGYEKVPFTPDGSCEKCKYGWYKEHSSNSGNSEEDRWKCKQCPNTKTTIERGADDPILCIDACPEGYELDNNTNMCVACAIGFYKDVSSSNITVDMGRRWWCQQCPTGQTTLFNASTSQNDCLNNCEAGKELSVYTSAGTCERCHYGWYKPHSSSDVNITAAERWNCSRCPEGTTTMYEESTSFSHCLPLCSEGYELDNATRQCRPCDIGLYKEFNSTYWTVSVNERWWCQQCPVGETTLSTATKNQTDCLAHCAKGEELSEFSPQGVCEDCDYGWYKPYSSSDVNITAAERWNCTQCPDGNTTINKRATSEDDCVPLCLKGYKYNSTTQFCDKCPIASYKNFSGNSEECTVCPNNLTTTKEGSYRLSHCHKDKCKCPCNLVGDPAKANLSAEQKAEILENHVKDLKVDKKKLSATIRKKISAPDNRPSSSAFGGLGIAMITLAIAILVFFDAATLKAHFIMFYHNMKAIIGRG